MRFRWLCIMLTLMLALAGNARAAALPAARTQEEVEAWIDYGMREGRQGERYPQGVTAGRIRHMAQRAGTDPSFVSEYWQGGEPGGVLDLTQRTHGEETYDTYCGNMCTRAVYAMALSYLGIDCTPGEMSAMLNCRELSAPYDQVTALLPTLRRVQAKKQMFDTMFANYEKDAAYSPVYVYLRKADGTPHALLIVARTGKKNGFWAVDPALHTVEGRATHLFRIRFDSTRREIVATNCPAYAHSTMVYFCQWMVEAEQTPDARD